MNDRAKPAAIYSESQGRAIRKGLVKQIELSTQDIQHLLILSLGDKIHEVPEEEESQDELHWVGAWDDVSGTPLDSSGVR